MSRKRQDIIIKDLKKTGYNITQEQLKNITYRHIIKTHTLKQIQEIIKKDNDVKLAYRIILT